MAGKKRAKYDDATLKEISKKLEIMQKIIDDTISGKSMMEGINEQCLNMHQFRRVLEVVHTMQINDKISSKSAPQRLDKDFICSPVEALYGDIFGIHDDAWDNYSIPEDAEESIRHVLNDLTEREQVAIEEYYFNEKTLEEVGKRFNVNRERARQMLTKALRKLRHPSRANLLSVGITEWNRQQEVIKEQARIEAEEIQKAFEKRLEETVNNISDNDALFNSLINMNISDLELSVRSYNCLHRSCHFTVEDIIKENIYGITSIRNLGRKSATEVIGAVYRVFLYKGLSLENVFSMRQAMLKLPIADEKYERFVRTILEGGNPWNEENLYS